MQLSYSQLQAIADTQASKLKTSEHIISTQEEIIKNQNEMITILEEKMASIEVMIADCNAQSAQIIQRNETLEKLCELQEAYIKKLDPNYESDLASITSENSKNKD